MNKIANNREGLKVSSLRKSMKLTVIKAENKSEKNTLDCTSNHVEVKEPSENTLSNNIQTRFLR